MGDVKNYFAHHGTSEKRATEIQISKNFEISRNDDHYFKCLDNKRKHYHWLGEGVYFWDDDFEMAKLWAEKRYRDEAVAVIEVQIECEREKILDLRTRKHKEAIYNLISILIKTEAPDDFNLDSLEVNQKNALIGYACETICKNNNDLFDMCYNDFEIQNNNNLFQKVTPQICVKNKDIIKFDTIKII